MTIIFVVGAFIFGIMIGFVLVALRIAHKPSGILHIKETSEKDYYTIEITDDLESISQKREILLLVKSSRQNHTL